MSEPPIPVRTRRPPPAYRRVAVERVAWIGPRLVRVTFSGPSLVGLTVEQPAASVRLLVPSAGTSGLVMPAWNGNEFLLPDGRRPLIRPFTPRRAGPERLDLEIVVHDAATPSVSAWAQRAQPGDETAISGTGRGYEVDAAAPAFLLAGDESAIPAISDLLEVLPSSTPVTVHIEVAHPDGRVPLPDHPASAVTWHDLEPGLPPGDAFVAAVRAADVDASTRVWVAGEAAAVQRVRRYLFEERALPRDTAWVRGYWKHGRAGDGETAT